jgi:O-antigen/teichoic acid export membrane protein
MTLLRRLWQMPAPRAFQAFQVVRLLCVLGGAVAVARVLGLGAELARYESYWLTGTLLTFALRSGLGNHFLAAWGAAAPADQGRVLARHSGVARWMAGVSALGALGFGLYLYPDFAWGAVGLALFTGGTLAGQLSEYYLLVSGQGQGLWRYAGFYFVGWGLALGFPLVLGVGADGLMMGLGGFGLAVWCVYVFQTWALGVAQPLGRDWRSLWPLVGASLAAGAATHIDAALVRAFCPPDVFVWFRYGAREMPFILVLANAFAAAHVTRLAEAFRHGGDAVPAALESLKLGSQGLGRRAGFVTLLLLGLAPWAYVWVYGPDFAPAAAIFQWFLLLNVPRMVFPQTVWQGLLAHRLLLLVSLGELSLHATLSFWWVQLWGPLGVAAATVVAYAFEKGLLVTLLWYRRGIAPNHYISLREWALISGLTLAVFLALQAFG